MTMRLEVKVGAIELSFEGAVEIFEQKIEATFKDLLDLAQSKLSQASHLVSPLVVDQVTPPRSVGPISSMTVKSIAAKLAVSSGPELVVAAIASLSIFGGKDTVTRSQLIDEMKLATGYFKTSYRGNLTSSLDGLIKKNILIEVSKDTYALKETAKSDLEQRLAQ